jgi:hypothetical protein
MDKPVNWLGNVFPDQFFQDDIDGDQYAQNKIGGFGEEFFQHGTISGNIIVKRLVETTQFGLEVLKPRCEQK